MVMAPASGPSWWYLAFKNWVAASGVKPRATFIFFRDTNLTDTMFRLRERCTGTSSMSWRTNPSPSSIGWWRRAGAAGGRALYSAVNRVYEVDLARAWMEPAIRELVHALATSRPGDRRPRSRSASTSTSASSTLRKDVASDLGARGRSGLRTAICRPRFCPSCCGSRASTSCRSCFVRVQRRPVGNRPATAVARAAAVRRRSQGLDRSHTAASSTTTPAIPR